MSSPTVFISSTFLEFEVERRELQRILTCVLGVPCRIAEDLTCDTSDLDAELKKWIDEADIIILLLGIRYGSKRGKISWTEKEVKYAKDMRKRILPYFKKQDPPSPILDLDESKRKALGRFIRFIEKEIAPNIPRFSDMAKLVGMAVRDVMHTQEKHDREDYENSFT
jgi:hypothetical protein